MRACKYTNEMEGNANKGMSEWDESFANCAIAMRMYKSSQEISWYMSPHFADLGTTVPIEFLITAHGWKYDNAKLHRTS